MTCDVRAVLTCARGSFLKPHTYGYRRVGVHAALP